MYRYDLLGSEFVVLGNGIKIWPIFPTILDRDLNELTWLVLNPFIGPKRVDLIAPERDFFTVFEKKREIIITRNNIVKVTTGPAPIPYVPNLSLYFQLSA